MAYRKPFSFRIQQAILHEADRPILSAWIANHTVTCNQASLFFFSRQEGTPDTIALLFVCRPLIKISVSKNVGDAIS